MAGKTGPGNGKLKIGQAARGERRGGEELEGADSISSEHLEHNVMKQTEGRVLAGIDIGTLTCRLLVANVSGDGVLTELQAERKVLRLGEGFAHSHRLGQVAMSRVIETLRGWRQVIEGLSVEGEVAVATSAVREAVNRQEFLQLARMEAGFDVEVLSGEEEARRTMLGIRSGLPSGTRGVLGLDIGGGSTEFMLDWPGDLPQVRSMNIGVVRLTEEVLTHDPPTASQVQSARKLIQAHAVQVKQELGDVANATLVGTAGAITTLAAMVQKLRVYQPDRIHNYRLPLKTICDLEQELLCKTAAQRQGMAGLEAGREDVIVAGALILRGIMEVFGFATCRVSDFGLREGIVLDLAARLARSCKQ